MQAHVDATCMTCEQIIRWNTMMPRLCNDCLTELVKPEPPVIVPVLSAEADDEEAVA